MNSSNKIKKTAQVLVTSFIILWLLSVVSYVNVVATILLIYIVILHIYILRTNKNVIKAHENAAEMLKKVYDKVKYID
jgi:hypothetical protein